LQNTVPAPRARVIQIHNSGSADVQICYNGPKPYQFNFW
jgi:hypothetical protein